MHRALEESINAPNELVYCTSVEGDCCLSCHDEFDLEEDYGEVGDFVLGKYEVRGYSCCRKRTEVQDRIEGRVPVAKDEQMSSSLRDAVIDLRSAVEELSNDLPLLKPVIQEVDKALAKEDNLQDEVNSLRRALDNLAWAYHSKLSHKGPQESCSEPECLNSRYASR